MCTKSRFFRILILWIASIGMPCLGTACQAMENSSRETSSITTPQLPLPSDTPTTTSFPTIEPMPSHTVVPTVTPLPTQTILSPTQTEAANLVINEAVLERLLDPCGFKLRPVDPQYPNPQANLDPQTGTTWMTITVTEGVLFEQDSFHYWWDTRAFRGDLSFNVGDGNCQVLIDTNQIQCEGLPLRGTGSLSTGGYEYDFKLYIQNENCPSELNYQQRGLIFMETLEHDVFQVNGADVR